MKKVVVLLVLLVLLVCRVVHAECALLRSPAEQSTAFVTVEFADQDDNPISPQEVTRIVYDESGSVIDGPVTVASPGSFMDFSVPFALGQRGKARVVQVSWKWGPSNVYQNVLRCMYTVLPIP